MIIERTTHRGFRRIEFRDIYDKSCSLQESSLATDYAVWFGVDENRMHLNQDLARELLPLLETFANTGQLPDYE
jgi:hypothetical protein